MKTLLIFFFIAFIHSQLVANYYYGNSCSGKPAFQISYITNKCISSGSSSSMYTCNNGLAFFQTCTDTACSVGCTTSNSSIAQNNCQFGIIINLSLTCPGKLIYLKVGTAPSYSGLYFFKKKVLLQ
jgi:hypothetical protein